MQSNICTVNRFKAKESRGWSLEPNSASVDNTFSDLQLE